MSVPSNFVFFLNSAFVVTVTSKPLKAAKSLSDDSVFETPGDETWRTKAGIDSMVSPPALSRKPESRWLSCCSSSTLPPSASTLSVRRSKSDRGHRQPELVGLLARKFAELVPKRPFELVQRADARARRRVPAH